MVNSGNNPNNQSGNVTYNISNQIQEKLRQGSIEGKNASAYSEYLQSLQNNNINNSSYYKAELLGNSVLEPGFSNAANNNNFVNKSSFKDVNIKNSENSLGSKPLPNLNSNQINMSNY